MDEVTARVHVVYLMTEEQSQVAASHQTNATNMHCESACKLLSPTSTV